MQPPKSAGKDLILRIRPNYLKGGDWLRNGKHWLGVVLAFIAGGYGLCAWTISPTQLSPGPLASPHAMWDNNCATCHEPFTPTSPGAVQLCASRPRKDNENCQKCHIGAGHHEHLSADNEFSCAVCHREHQGRDAMLTQVADGACVECHRDLKSKSARPAGDSFAVENTTAFPGNHPEFRSIKDGDRGRLKFSHRLHMSRGITRKSAAELKENGAGGMRLQDIDKQDQGRYAEIDGFVQLDCSSCHDSAPRSDIGADTHLHAATSIAAPSSNGDYMQPIDFEKHCSACHQNTWSPGVDVKVAAGVDAATALRSTRETSTQMPHGLKAGDMSRVLQEAVLQRIVKMDPAQLDQPLPLRQVPGRLPQVDGSTTLQAKLDQDIAAAKRDLNHDCAKCHMGKDGQAPPDVTVEDIGPVNVPAVWLKYAKFNHAPHRTVSCIICHKDAYEYDKWDGGGAALDHDKMMIPQKQVCASCHAPQHTDTNSGERRGGARHDCAECHRYHQVDHLPADSDRWRHDFDKRTADVGGFIGGAPVPAK